MEGTLGTVQLFGGNFAPRNWIFCDGQILSISQNTALFSLLGTIYGGDGRTTFGLPDLRGHVVVGAGNGPGLSSVTLGQRFGVNDVAISNAQMPAHNHTVGISATGIGANSATANQHPPAAGRSPAVADAGANLPFYSDQTPDTTVEGAAVTGSLALATAGSNGSHENRMPFLALNYIICLAGTFPSRN